ncbi:MAG: GAF domain-containing protein [Anaerolineales bacterium]|nr:GAF domain-containing protein [Anaerolineales bacterium]
MTSRSPTTPPSTERAHVPHNARRIGYLLLITAGLMAAVAIGLYLSEGHLPAAVLVLIAAGMTTLVALIGLWLNAVGHTRLAIWLPAGFIMLAGPVAIALFAEIGVPASLALLLAVSAITALTLAGAEARAMILAGVVAGALTLSLDLLLESNAFWPRLSLPTWFHNLALPVFLAVSTGLFGILLWRQFPRYRLSSKFLLGFVIAALTPLILGSWRTDRDLRANLSRTTNQALLAAASRIAADIDSFITANRLAISGQARLPLLSAYLRLPAAERNASPLAQEVRALLLSLLTAPGQGALVTAETRNTSAYFLLDAGGELVMSTSPGDRPEPNLTEVILRTPLTSGQAYLSPVYYRGATGALYFFAPVTEPGQAPIGVLVARVNAAWLQRFIQLNHEPLGPDSASVAALFNEDGLRLADSAAAGTNALRFAALPATPDLNNLFTLGRAPARTPAELDAGLPELAARLAEAHQTDQPTFFEGVIHYTDDPAEPEPRHLAVLLPLRNAPWVVLVSQPETVALAPVRAQTRSNILLAMVTALGVTGLAAVATRNLTRPITTLTQVAERVRKGDLSARATPFGEDEITELTKTFNAMTGQLQSALTKAEQLVAERTAQLEATADISRATAGIRDLDELLSLAVELIRGRFGFYHASIFLLDEAGEYAVLRESTGEIGAQLKARGHRLAVGSRSLVGWVTQNRRLRVARDVADDPFHFKNPLLPETRSECCLPLMVGDRLLGALDVQSREPDDFNENDLKALQVLADQLSIAIENAKLFERTQAALAEVQALYQRILNTSWRNTLVEQNLLPRTLIYDLEPGGAESDNPILVPLRLRGQLIGVIELHGRPEEQPLSAQEQAVLETVALQIASALESVALLQESQARSRRDQLITAISDEMRSSLNPTFIVQSGIRQLGRALGATEVIIRLQPQPTAKALPDSAS